MKPDLPTAARLKSRSECKGCPTCSARQAVYLIEKGIGIRKFNWLKIGKADRLKDIIDTLAFTEVIRIKCVTCGTMVYEEEPEIEKRRVDPGDKVFGDMIFCCGKRRAVKDTRENSGTIKRVRECSVCKTRTTTIEVLVSSSDNQAKLLADDMEMLMGLPVTMRGAIRMIIKNLSHITNEESADT